MYYNQISKGYDRLHGEEQLKKLRIIKEYFEELKILSSDTKLLDVGCGTGLSARVFNCRITGIEPAEMLLKQASFPTKKAKAEKIPFPAKSFDIVICVTAAHNFDNIEKGLKEIKRVGHYYAITVLKKSRKADEIERIIKKLFDVETIIEEEKDKIFICREYLSSMRRGRKTNDT